MSNTAKQTDSRFADYSAKFGDESWELDALNPDVLVEIVQKAIEGVVNPNVWEDDEATEERMKESLKLVSDRWDEVTDFASKPAKKTKKKK